MTRVGLGLVALTGGLAPELEQANLAWHQLKHVPELYGADGVLNAQRWVSTTACRDQRAIESELLAPVESVISYLLGKPAKESYDSMLSYSQSLPREQDRPPGGEVLLDSFFEPLATAVAARVELSAHVLPWRPNRGIYLLVDELDDEPDALARYRMAWEGQTAEMLAVPGVAGLWLFGSDRDFPGVLTSQCEGTYAITIAFLDDDPANVGAALAPQAMTRTKDLPAQALLAAPFESIPQWNWERFA
jgi:hypothetical protein